MDAAMYKIRFVVYLHVHVYTCPLHVMSKCV